MATPGILAPLEDLPATTRELARATVLAARKVLAGSADSVAPESGMPRGLLAVRRTVLDLQFYVARDRTEVIFFFFKRQLPTVRPLAARLQVCIQAVPALPTDEGSAEPLARGQDTPSARVAAYRYRLLVPPFLIARPSAEELALYAPPGTTADSGVLLRMGPGGSYVLAIRDPEADKRAAAVYTTRTRQPLLTWQVEPFLSLIEALRSWLADGMPATAEVDLALPTQLSAMTDVHATLFWFVEAYRSLQSGREGAEAEPLPPALTMVMPSYQAQDFSADISLCVDRNGQFAARDAGSGGAGAGNDKPVSLGLGLTIQSQHGQTVASIALRPPDFLISGELHAAFLHELRENAPRDFLRAVGAVKGSDWSAFLDSAAARAVIFRTDHANHVDTDTVVLSGSWRGDLRTLIICVIATVDASAKPVSIKLSGVTLCYDSLGSRGQTLDDQTVSYFMRLAAAFKDWLRVVR